MVVRVRVVSPVGAILWMGILVVSLVAVAIDIEMSKLVNTLSYYIL